MGDKKDKNKMAGHPRPALQNVAQNILNARNVPTLAANIIPQNPHNFSDQLQGHVTGVNNLDRGCVSSPLMSNSARVDTSFQIGFGNTRGTYRTSPGITPVNDVFALQSSLWDSNTTEEACLHGSHDIRDLWPTEYMNPELFRGSAKQTVGLSTWSPIAGTPNDSPQICISNSVSSRPSSRMVDLPVEQAYLYDNGIEDFPITTVFGSSYSSMENGDTSSTPSSLEKNQQADHPVCWDSHALISEVFTQPIGVTVQGPHSRNSCNKTGPARTFSHLITGDQAVGRTASQGSKQLLLGGNIANGASKSYDGPQCDTAPSSLDTPSHHLIPRAVFPEPHPVFCSPNYRGNALLPGNQSAKIPEWESCSVWITNLNLPATEEAYHELLSAVCGCGKVFASVINPPDPSKGHTTSAAKLVFFHWSGAAELLRRSAIGEFVINNYVPKVVYNRIRTASQPSSPVSRVIHIEGPKHIVEEGFLRRFFSKNFDYQTEEVITLNEEPSANGRRRIEWRFGSYRCQAATAVSLIEKQRRCMFPGVADHTTLWRHVNVYYGIDPCALLK